MQTTIARVPEPAPLDPIPDKSRRRVLKEWLLFLLKNLVGYLFLALSVVLGPVPGPGGIVLFMIGFALIGFPGKRRLTARIFRGRAFTLSHWFAHSLAVLVGGLLPWGLLWWFVWRPKGWLGHRSFSREQTLLIYAGLALLCWALALGLMRLANWMIRLFPKIRRKIRPWLRRHGVDLLPPRIRQRVHQEDGSFSWRRHDTGEVVRFHPRHGDRVKRIWKAAKPWLKRLIGVAITVAIFAWMLKPVITNWEQVAPYVRRIKWGYFGIAACMFAAFLFFFRVLSWRLIVAGFGHRLPIAPATRIWSTSELARYLPGAIWQVIGRVYLVKPYGVNGTVCSISQLLELVAFLLANVLVAIACLFFFIYRMEQYAKTYLIIAVCLVPLLMLLLHPKVFYTALTKYLTWRKKELPAQRVRGKTLTLLTIWAIVGLLWQSFAIWLIVNRPLGLPIEKWWIVAGAYCLAWCAGFIAFWAPGGLGVREFVFVMVTAYALPNSLPPKLKVALGDPAVLAAFLAYVGILLRLWTIVGELILTAVAYLFDIPGALGRPDAPGRVATSTADASLDQASEQTILSGGAEQAPAVRSWDAASDKPS